MPLDKILTAAGLTRFLVRLGYSDATVAEVVRARHPDAPMGELLAEARAQKDKSDRELEADLDREALEQEHRP